LLTRKGLPATTGQGSGMKKAAEALPTWPGALGGGALWPYVKEEAVAAGAGRGTWRPKGTAPNAPRVGSASPRRRLTPVPQRLILGKQEPELRGTNTPHGLFV